jgi:hypothetical protein
MIKKLLWALFWMTLGGLFYRHFKNKMDENK